MKSFYNVRVRCNENGNDVEAGEFSGVAGSIDEAMAKAVAMAKRQNTKATTNYRVTSAHEVGRVQFGLGK